LSKIAKNCDHNIDPLELAHLVAFYLDDNTILSRVARFFLVQNTKTGSKIPNDHKIYQIFGHKIFPMAVK
jgi:hypothetical protein